MKEILTPTENQLWHKIDFDCLDYNKYIAACDACIPAYFELLASLRAHKNYPESLKKDPSLLGQHVDRIWMGISLYFMRCKERDSDMRYLKIGIAQSVSNRLSQVQTGCPLKIMAVRYFYVGQERAARIAEKASLKSVKDYSVGGEWIGADNKKDFNEIVETAVNAASASIGSDPRMYTYNPLRNNRGKDECRDFLQRVWDRLIKESVPSDVEWVDKFERTG